jgi:hypothetical protein
MNQRAILLSSLIEVVGWELPIVLCRRATLANELDNQTSIAQCVHFGLSVSHRVFLLSLNNQPPPLAAVKELRV